MSGELFDAELPGYMQANKRIDGHKVYGELKECAAQRVGMKASNVIEAAVEEIVAIGVGTAIEGPVGAVSGAVAGLPMAGALLLRTAPDKSDIDACMSKKGFSVPNQWF